MVRKKDISNTMSKFFCSIGNDLANDTDPVPNPLLSGDYQVNANRVKFHFKTIEVQEIRDAFAKIKTSKSFGTDNISSYFLRLALPFVENFIAGLFNTSIETGQFPDLWKVARVTPIFKDGDRTDKGNYRPISVLPIISRPFEKLVANQLYQHLNDHRLFSNSQSGFLRLFSTTTCLLKNTNNWYSGLDCGELVGLVFIDLKKAFDTVDHKILCSRLAIYGIQHRELSWFESYVANRKQFCKVNGVGSETGILKLEFHRALALAPYSSLFISMISHLLSRIVMSPCMLIISACATNLMI